MIRKSLGGDKAVPGPAARAQKSSKPARVGGIPLVLLTLLRLL